MTPTRLGAIDATYLAVEDERTPLHIESIGIFERGDLLDEHGQLRLGVLRQRINGRLNRLPRLRQRVVEVPLGLGRPVWADDVHFDIVNHVDAIALEPPGDEAQLLRVAEQLAMEPLDRTRPLWHLRFVTGLSGDRVALIERAHHAMVDGVSGVDASLAILDTEPDAGDDPLEPWSPDPTPTPFALVSRAIADRIAAPVAVAARALRSTTSPQHLAQGLTAAVRTVQALRHDGFVAPRTTLNQPIGHHRRLALVRESLESVHEVAKANDAKVNDVVLAAVACGLRELLMARGESIASTLRLKVLVPVSVRASEESMALGNRVGALLLPLPIGIGDPHVRLATIADATRTLKASDEAAAADELLQLADLLPPSLSKLVGRGVHRQPLVNLVVTNIPGPPFPLYALGARLLEAFPVVPLGGNMPLEVAVLSYCGALNLCVSYDEDACADAPTFVDGLERGFEQLGVHSQPAMAVAEAR